MKKYLPILLCAVTLSCKQGYKSIPTADTTTALLAPTRPAVAYNDEVLSQYSSFLGSLSDTVLTNTVVAAKRFSELFKGQDKNTCDSGYLMFENYHLALNGKLDEMHSKDGIGYDSVFTDTTQFPARLSLRLAELKENGFYVGSSEGMTFIQPDFDFVAKWFYGKVSPVMKTYLVQQNKEDKERFSEDAGLMITPKQLAQRVVWWEDFFMNNPYSLITPRAKANWIMYLDVLLSGMDNSPVVEYADNTISPDYQMAYKYMQRSHPISESNKFVAPYYELLLKKDKNGADRLLKQYRNQWATDY